MLKKLTQQATDLILHSIASGEVMGANLLITKGNEELVYAQAGMADREAEKPIERNTIFRLYSMTKPIQQWRQILRKEECLICTSR